MPNTKRLLAQLNAHTASDAEETRHLRDTQTFVSQHPQRWWQRSTLVGHITASALVIEASHQLALLLFHAKLSRWLQPGGHLDDADESSAHGALRECREETGLTDLRLLSNQLFDIDVHTIPARNEEPAHRHYDLRYLLEAPNMDAVNISNESRAYRWIDLSQLSKDENDASIRRMARKFMARKCAEQFQERKI